MLEKKNSDVLNQRYNMDNTSLWYNYSVSLHISTSTELVVQQINVKYRFDELLQKKALGKTAKAGGTSYVETF